jgi:2-hydroxychromene-2-carboxylate isomerase
MASAPTLEFWFDFGSTYSYLAAMRMEPLAHEAGVQILWRPFLLGPIFNILGWNTSPFVLQKEKGDYMWRDMERLAGKYGLPWKRPSTFPRAAVYPMRVAVAHDGAAWVPAFCKAMFELNFRHDRDINDNAVCTRVLDELAHDGAGLVEEAQAPANKEKLRRQTEEAWRRRIFGAPTFFAGPEMFWGNDRLEDALSFAAARQPAG